MLCKLMEMKQAEGCGTVSRRMCCPEERTSECSPFVCVPKKIPSNTDVQVEVRPDGTKCGRIQLTSSADIGCPPGRDPCRPRPVCCPEIPTLCCPKFSVCCPEMPVCCPEVPICCPKLPLCCPKIPCCPKPVCCPKPPSCCPKIPVCCPPKQNRCCPMPVNNCPKKDNFFKKYVCENRPPPFVKRGPYLTDAGIPEDCARHIPDHRLIKYVACKSRHNGLQDECDPISEEALRTCCRSNRNY